jgi:hypothetical protein
VGLRARAIVEPRMPQILLKCVDIATLPHEQISARLAIAAHKVAVVDRFLLKLNGTSAAAVVASSKSCPAKIAAVMPAEHLAGIAGEKGVLEQMLVLDDGDGRLIAKLASFPTGAAAIVGQVSLFSDEIQNPQTLRFLLTSRKSSVTH